MENDDDWEFEIDNGQVESIAERISAIAAAEAREKMLVERRKQEESDRALTEDLFAEGRTILPTVQPSTPPKKQNAPKNETPKKTKVSVKLPPLKKPTRNTTEQISKSKQKYIEAELFGDSTYLTQDEIIGCEYEEEYYNR
jgi:hypothetical protein